jgi:hypothetical protein
MGANRSRTSTTAWFCLAGLLLVGASSALAHPAKLRGALGSSCNHPLISTPLGGTGARYYSVRLRADASDSGQDELDVAIHNSRVVICRAVVEERAGGGSTKALRTFHPAIGSHGGLSSPLPRPGLGSGAILYAKVYARLEPSKTSPTTPSPTSGCTLANTWDGFGEDGDKQDFSVKLEETGTSPGPYSAQIDVTIHNPKVEICEDSISWYEGNGATGQHTAPVTIGVHGGLSSRVSLPVGADAVFAKVTARLK